MEPTDVDKDYLRFKKLFPILIVDDNDDHCVLLERYLNRIGFHNIQIARRGFEALAMKDKVDLMLLDVEMPDISGVEVLKQLKNEITTRHLSVLMITAIDTLENIIECIKLGAEDFLPKPFFAELLRVRIDSCVDKKWSLHKEKIYVESLKYERERYEKLLNEKNEKT